MNPSVSGHYPLLRHDPVTARAISRLSHGVARLTASLNPESQYRHFRARHAKSRNRIVSESLSTDSQCITAGSKRKWQPDKIELDTIMELEHPTINLKQTASPCVNLPHSSTEFLHHVSVSIDALNLQTKLLTPFSCSNPVLHKSMSSDNIETVGRYSSGSSMLSVTASSDNNCESDASSHDADVEDEDHNDLTYLKGGRSSLSRISKRKTLFDKQFYEIWKPFDDNVCNGGGDSSDGLSINIKIPRLSSMHLHGTSTGISDYSSTLSPISSHHSTKRCVHNMLASSSSDTNRPRKDKCKCKLRNIKNDSVHNNHKNGDHNCHKGCVKSGSRSSSSSSTISTEESSDQTYSKGFNMHKHRYTSIPECHKNYDGDKKVTACDNTKFPKKCSKSSVNTANDNNSSKQSVLPQAKLQYRPVDPYNSTLDEPVDPELDNLLHGTWPLLSGRAKLGYAKAMNASNSKRYPNSQKKIHPILRIRKIQR
ncbi:unnamed protein product [Heterobilharzia americana]|nr:unnamed protein product [Heterobilharzia americana]